MNPDGRSSAWTTEKGVREDLQRQPHLFMRLAENALTVAESLRGNYLINTANFIGALRRAIQQWEAGKRDEPVLTVASALGPSWADLQSEVVTFIDGGIGQVQISSPVPILLRVGSYTVRTGEHRLAEREQFGYYPVVLGDIEGGSKERKDFLDVVRITAELLGGLAALKRTPDLRVLMFHGPLVYLVGNYTGQTPFTEADIDLFLRQYGPDPSFAQQLKEQFLNEAKLDIYPRMTDRSDEWVERRLFEPISWMAFLYRQLIREAQLRPTKPLIVGVVERGEMRQFSERMLLERVFRGLRANGKSDYFNSMYGRKDLTSPAALLDRLGYTDTLLMGLLLEPGQYSEPWEIDKFSGLRIRSDFSLPGEAHRGTVDYSILRPGHFGFPCVRGFYLQVSEVTDPVRVEIFSELGAEQVQVIEAAQRVYLYSRLLPGYGFPVGLDIVDKYAHVPGWLTEAYGKLIRYQLSLSLQQGEVSDAEMRRVLVQSIYMTHRDWLFRPKA